MKLPSYFWFILISFVFFACEEDENAPGDPSFSIKMEGKPMKVFSAHFSSHQSHCDGPGSNLICPGTPIGYTYNVSAHDRDPFEPVQPGDEDIYFQITDFNKPITVGTYEMGFNPMVRGGYSSVVSGGNPSTVLPYHTASGYITITALNPKAGYTSGSFDVEYRLGPNEFYHATGEFKNIPYHVNE